MLDTCSRYLLPFKMLKRIGALIFLWFFMFFVISHWNSQYLNGNNIQQLVRNDQDSDSGRIGRSLNTEGSRQVATEADDPNSFRNDTASELVDEDASAELENLAVDTSKPKSEFEIAVELEKKIPSMPLTYWMKRRIYAINFNKSCALFPSLHDVKYNNIYWQVLSAKNNSEFYLYGAYYDDRPLVTEGPVVRILAMINRIEPPPTLCQFWVDGRKSPYFSERSKYKYMWITKWGNYKNNFLQPYIITCKIPPEMKKKHLIPATVSLVENPCDNATTHMRVLNDRPEKKGKFAVCVKGLTFLQEDVSVRLIEWIEVLHILGAEKIFTYEIAVHPNVSKVLRYYEDLGWVSSRPLKLPGGQMNVPEMMQFYLKARVTNKRQNELIPYNDCLYRNLHSYDYLALLDTDEIIMPRAPDVTDWHKLMDFILPKTLPDHSAYCAQNVYFFHDALTKHGRFPDIPQYMHMLQHVFRSRNFTKPGSYVKCFHRVETVLHLHNHYPLGCLTSNHCRTYSMSTQDAQMQHYRKDCDAALKNCSLIYKENQVVDDVIWQFKNQLIDRTKLVLNDLGFFRKKENP